MLRLLLWMVTFAIVTPVLNARADEPQKANDFYLECTAGMASCYNYLVGAWDGAALIQTVAKANIVCLIGPPNAEQLRLAFVNYAAKHPEQLSMNRGVVVMLSYANTFTCNAPKL